MKNICVFCGSNPGKNPLYQEQAIRLGEALAQRQINLIYGASDLGLMGQVAAAVLAGGGTAIGIMPEIFRTRVQHPQLSELIITADMSERKALMLQKAEGFISLPGGVGTLEELFEMITLGQIGYHQKPSAILNVAGFYDPLIKFLDQMTAQKFMRPEFRQAIIISSEIEEILDKMQNFQPPQLDKWLDR
ncbi:MAG: TIGR00730 family Rossman fold protein [Candidatus Cloacimonadales bacterium]